jgi:flagellar basal-body rod protein FlgG
MIKALHIGASGMSAQQKCVDTIANNIANINTTGYTKSRAEFKEAMYSRMVNPDNAASTVNLQQGNGVLLSGISKIYTQTIYIETDSPLDLSISGKGYFAALNKNGEYCYTRDGNFKASAEEGEQYLVTSKGQYVLGPDMEKIRLTGDLNKIKIDTEGFITFSDGEESAARIGVFEFLNQNALEAAGDNLYIPSAASGGPAAMNKPHIRQKSLEGSNVDLTEEITQLIKAQRAYQIAAKAVNTADEMEGLANNLRI